MAAAEFFPGDDVLVRNRGDSGDQDQVYRRGRLVHKVQSCRGLWVVESCGSRQLLSALDLVRLDPGNLEPRDPGNSAPYSSCTASKSFLYFSILFHLAAWILLWLLILCKTTSHSANRNRCLASICCYDNSLITWPSSCHHSGCTTCLQYQTRTQTGPNKSGPGLQTEPGLQTGPGLQSGPRLTYGQGSGSVFLTREDDKESVQSTESRQRPPWRNWRRTGPEPHHKRPGGPVSCSSPQVCYVSFPSAQSRSSANYSSALFLPLTNLMKWNIQTQAPPPTDYSQSQQHL